MSDVAVTAGRAGNEPEPTCSGPLPAARCRAGRSRLRSRLGASSPASACGSSSCTGGRTASGRPWTTRIDFLITLLNRITAPGLYFIVASGFTLIFGLMRVVNMAHGRFFLLGGYIALKMQQTFVGADSASACSARR